MVASSHFHTSLESHSVLTTIAITEGVAPFILNGDGVVVFVHKGLGEWEIVCDFILEDKLIGKGHHCGVALEAPSYN